MKINNKDFDHEYVKRIEPSSTVKFNLNENKSLFEAEGEEEIEIEMRERLLLEPQSISLIRIYRHFFETIDYLYLIIAIIGGIISGICTPLLFYSNSDNYSRIGNTEETRNIKAPPQVIEMILQEMHNDIRKSMNKNIRRQLIIGAVAFVSNFLNLLFGH